LPARDSVASGIPDPLTSTTMNYRPPHLEGPTRGPIARLLAAFVSATALVVAAVLGAFVFLVALGVLALLFVGIWLRVTWLKRRLRNRAGGKPAAASASAPASASASASASGTTTIDGVYRVIDPAPPSKRP
jgi:hypothetical protein